MSTVFVLFGGTADLLAIAYLLHLLRQNTPDWSGRPSIIGCVAAVVGVLTITVALTLLGHFKWAAFAANAPLLLAFAALAVVAAIALLGGGRWN